MLKWLSRHAKYVMISVLTALVRSSVAFPSFFSREGAGIRSRMRPKALLILYTTPVIHLPFHRFGTGRLRADVPGPEGANA